VALTAVRRKQGVASDHELSAAALGRLITTYEELIASHGTPFPQDPREQLWGAIGAVFGSWNNQRARDYRRLNHIIDAAGTAVNVQAMVYGNRGSNCATGVAFTRNPSTGEPALFGEFLVNAQGEDVVAGIRTPQEIRAADGSPGLGGLFPAAYAELLEVAERLEKHFGDMQDLEFTIEADRLFLLQARTGKRTGPAAVRIAVDLCREGRITPDVALSRVQPSQLGQLLAPGFDEAEKRRAIDSEGRLLAVGLPAGPGAASGRIVLEASRAEEWSHQGPVILVREETSPEDIVGMHAAEGIVTARGGMTSHAAVVARGLGKPCVAGAEALIIDEVAGTVTVGGQVLREGDALSIDGSHGQVLSGSLSPHPSPVLRHLIDGETPEDPAMVEAFVTLLEWADQMRRLRVRANADTPHDAKVARAFGAEGIGLCRTEHMFFAEDRISWVRQMILAASDAERQNALDHLLPVQQADFEGIFEAMAGCPVTVRLLDPPLHEFLPREAKAIEHLAEQMGITPQAVEAAVAALGEINPMLGHRGCRLGLTTPAIYAMQVEAIVGAACRCVQRGIDVRPEIMLPLVGLESEIRELRAAVNAVVERVQEAMGVRVDLLIGTMIEVPRACLIADRIAEHADFFSFGTNDLTQMTFGFSRDDAGRFLPKYVENKLLAVDPFERLDIDGVGQLVEMATRRGRSARHNLKVGICGEHGGEPTSIAFFERCGLDYVSCSPYRLPIARLAAARCLLIDGVS
jgi:pyruvate,orthophosphate dikinase